MAEVDTFRKSLLDASRLKDVVKLQLGMMKLGQCLDIKKTMMEKWRYTHTVESVEETKIVTNLEKTQMIGRQKIHTAPDANPHLYLQDLPSLTVNHACKSLDSF